MQYRRMVMEIESPEEFGYDNIKHNLAESSITDANLKDLDFRIDDLVLQYSDHRGKAELRELLASEGEGLKADDVLLTVGAAGALFIVSTALLREGDHVVVAFPNYALNIETPRALGCQVDFFELRFEEGFRLDVDRLAGMVRPETRLISLTNPHNPTGQTMTEDELRQVVELAEANDAYLILDETYREMSFDEPLPLAAMLSPRAFSVSSLSKTYGLPGLRMGWLINRDPALMETFLAGKEQIHIANSVLDEEVAYRYLREKDQHLMRIMGHIENNFGVVKNWMDAQNVLEWVEPQGGVVCFPRIRADENVDVDKFYDVLKDTYKTFVGPGHWFEVDRRFMRIGYGWPDRNNLALGLGNVSKALEDARAG